MIVQQKKDWIPPLDYVFVKTDIYEESKIDQYTNALYHAVLMLGGNDVGPRGYYELFFVSVILVTTAIINANIFGNIALLIQSMNLKATKFQEKMEYAHDSMKNMKIPEKLQSKVKSYLSYTHNTQDHQQDMDKFLNMLSPSLKSQVSRYIFYDAIAKNSK
jgi:hypothetical protein